MVDSKYVEAIESSILHGTFEDNSRELQLALHHLERSDTPDDECQKLVKGLEKGIPIPYIIGYTLVCGLKILINRDVLNPGPETITLIKAVMGYASKRGSIDILDLCTGSGAIAVLLAKSYGAKVTAIDISEKALALAKENAAENGVDITFLRGDLFEPVRGMAFDVIVVNPPYVKSGSIEFLPKFVRDFAPTIAIDGGKDGLFFHKAILAEAKNHLNRNGSLFIECEDDQSEDVEKIAAEFSWTAMQRFHNRHGQVRGFQFV